MWRRLVLGLLVAGCAVSPSTPDAPSSIPNRTLDPDSPYQTTPEEYAIRLKACLEDRGFTVDVNPYDHSLSFSFGDSRESALVMAAVPECRASIDPSRSDPVPPRSAEQLRALYAYYVAQVDCLVAAGYPGSSAPPEQVFVDAGGGWDPRMGTEDVDIPQAVARRCEQVEGRPAFLDW